MKALFILLAAVVMLLAGYVFYGSWLAKQWGIDPSRKTPAVEKDDGVDYVAAPRAVLLGHHFSSIAGAGPINGPIQAAVFGWVPVFLWCVVGGIFFGGVHDFGSLFTSIRNDGKSVGEIMKQSMGVRAQKLFLIFILVTLVLMMASFTNIVAGTFYTPSDAEVVFGLVTNPTGNQTTAMVSVLFIVMAVIYGILTNRFGMHTGTATVLGLIGIVLSIVIGLYVGIAMSRFAWFILISLYILVASLLPVWILMQPRDYLSSFLLYGMMVLAVIGIVMSAFTGSVEFTVPAFTGWKLENGNTLFPVLFITVACGACSGVHSLIASGTSSKQLATEKDAKFIGYGGMLIESALAIVSLIAVGMVFEQYTSGAFGSPSVAFSSGIALMFGDEGTQINSIVAALLTLAVSVFALTSLDTAARLSRFIVTEFLLKEGEKSYRDASGVRAVMLHPLMASGVMVLCGAVLGYMELSKIWSMLGTANQMLAGMALLAIAAWLGEVGKNNRMVYIPMAFMICVSMASLCTIFYAKMMLLVSGSAVMEGGDWFQLVLSAAMLVLAVFLVVEGIMSFRKSAVKQ